MNEKELEITEWMKYDKLDEKPCNVCRLIWKRIQIGEKVHQSDWV
jgi:hypothetical protein